MRFLRAMNAIAEFNGGMDFFIAGILCVGVLGYLGYALFHPEKF